MERTFVVILHFFNQMCFNLSWNARDVCAVESNLTWDLSDLVCWKLSPSVAALLAFPTVTVCRFFRVAVCTLSLCADAAHLSCAMARNAFPGAHTVRISRVTPRVQCYKRRLLERFFHYFIKRVIRVDSILLFLRPGVRCIFCLGFKYPPCGYWERIQDPTLRNWKFDKSRYVTPTSNRTLQPYFFTMSYLFGAAERKPGTWSVS